MKESFPQIVQIDEAEANYNFWLQVLKGDGTDNISGIPGMGEVKGRKLLDGCLDPMQYPSKVQFEYQKCFGEYYGNLIFRETCDTVQMVQPDHKFWYLFPKMEELKFSKVRTAESIFAEE